MKQIYLNQFQNLSRKFKLLFFIEQKNKLHFQPMKKEKQKTNELTEAPKKVAEVFSLSRDVDVVHPYHMDGDVQMYTEEQLQARAKLRQDPQIVQILEKTAQLYEMTEVIGLGPVVQEKGYKQVQRELALIMRPGIDEEELKFVVDMDWQHDRMTDDKQTHYMNKQKLIDGLFELIDTWTVGTEFQEYLSFSKLIKKKLERALKIKK